MEEKPKKKFAVPHVYLLMLAIILILSILSYIIPASVYEYVDVELSDGSVRSVVDVDSFEWVDRTPVTLMQFLTAVPRGMQEVAQIIFFIFIVGGSMAVLEKTKAIEAAMGRLIRALKGKSIIILPIVIIFFSACGAIFGMAESCIAFIPIFVPLCIAMGYDSLTGTAIVMCGAGAGFAAAFLNPFTVQVAQGIAQVEILSGMGFRIVMYACFTALTIAIILRYAVKIKKNPQLSSMHNVDVTREDTVDLDSLPAFGGRQIAILLVFLAAIVILIIAVVSWGWGMDNIAGLFFVMGFIVAIIGGLGLNGYAEALANGMMAITSGALVVGFARGILVVMNDGNIMFTILHAAANVLTRLPSMISAVGMYIFQCLLNFLVPSGSGQAAATMPILAPLSDLVGVSRQTAVIAYQLGDGISNVFTPTSGYFMAGLALARIPWQKWAKWSLPLIGCWYALGAIFVIIAQAIGLE